MALEVHYHAAVSIYSPGERVARNGGPNYYSARVAAGGKGWVDQFLDVRPFASGRPRRATSVYCCPDIGCCARYADSEVHLGPRYKIYEVVPNGRVHAAPMVLVGCILARGAPDPVAESIADEYWNPTREWRFVEVLADSLEIIGEVSRPDLMHVLAGGARYDEDVERAIALGW